MSTHQRPQPSHSSSSFSPQHHPSADNHDQYQYSQPTIPDRGLSVRRSLIHERSTYLPSPSPPPQLPGSQSLLQQHQQEGIPKAAVPKWGLGGAGRGNTYSSVPSGDPELEDVQQGRGKSSGKSRSRSPKKKDRMSEERGVGVVAGAAGEPRFHPIAHPESSFSQIREHRRSMGSLHQQEDQYDPHGINNHNGNQQQQQRLYHEDLGYFNQPASTHQGLGEDSYSPSTSSARGFASAAAPIGRTGSPEFVPPPPIHEGGNDGYYGQQGGDYGYNNSYAHQPPQQQQYYNNNYTNYSENEPLQPPPPPLHADSRNGSSTSLHAAGVAVAAAAGLPAPNPPHLMGSGRMNRSSNDSFGSPNSNRQSMPVAGVGMGIDGGPYNRLSQMGGSATALGLDGQIDVNMLDENDPDDGLASPPPGPRHGILTGLRGGRSSHHSNNSGVLAGAAGAGAAAGALGAGLGGDGHASSGQVPMGSTAALDHRGPGMGGLGAGLGGEKESDWLASQKQSKKKTRTIAIIIIIILVIAIAGGAAAGVLLSKKKSNGSSDDAKSNSDLSSDGGKTNSDSDGKGTTVEDLGDDDGAWKEYLDNPKLHQVFHGIDYTPLDALYPECLQKPPTQSQVNIDVAIMSQLTSRVRLYGTDCDQAELVLNAIQTTGVDMKIWLGIWLDANATTNARSLEHMYDILDKYPVELFDGVVVGNEVLFRQEMTETVLGDTLAEIKNNLTDLGIDLPIGTSDLGSKWTVELAANVDVLMANIHPFFGGVDVKDAATWTMSFFENENVPKAKAKGKRAMISEVGWPTDGGTLQGSVAGVDELNTFLKDWVCDRLKDGTEYYWFSAFDEPWKKRYNEAGKEWEDKWGLLDADRKIKDGVEIPEC